jgi:hypothetical protein
MRRVQVFKFADRDSQEYIQSRINDWADKHQANIVHVAMAVATDNLHHLIVIVTYEQT